MSAILVVNGPNLNLLGIREPGHYGRDTLADIQARLVAGAEAAGHRLSFIQSNAEHALIEAIHNAGREGVDFIIINPAAFTHTSKYDESTNSITLNGTMVDPMSKQEMNFREVLKFLDNDHHLLEMYMVFNGEEFKSMEIEFVRQ